jgi:aldehyde dehydrogenase (NAD+)
MALLETTDNGKVIRETSSQMGYAARIFRYYAAWADKTHGAVIPLDQKDTFDFTVREPYGVVATITAWNSPVAILTNTLPAALAAGNCVVVKPSEHASVTTIEMIRLCEQAGFPAGVVNVVTGAAETGRALTTSTLVDKISFTGLFHPADDLRRRQERHEGRRRGNLRPGALDHPVRRGRRGGADRQRHALRSC